MSERSVDHWLDDLVDIWSGVTDGEGKKLTSYHVFTKNELPSAILATNAPCVASYIEDCEVQYSLGGPMILRWSGVSEFHLTRDVKPSNMRDVMLYYERILAAAMGNMKLNNKVAFFTILQEEPQAMMLATFTKPSTSEPDHQGIVVKWQVKQHVEGLYAVSA